MAKFVPISAASTSISEQWQRHLQTQEYVTDVTKSIEQSIDAHNERATRTDNIIQASSEMISDAVGNMAAEVSETIALAAMAEIEEARRNAAAIVGAVERSTESLSDAVYTVGQTLDDRLTVLIDSTESVTCSFETFLSFCAYQIFRKNAFITFNRVLSTIKMQL